MPRGRPPKDITGLRSGHLVAVRPTRYRSTSGHVMWRCDCLLCKGAALRRSADLINGNSICCDDCNYKVTRATKVEIDGETKSIEQWRRFFLNDTIDFDVMRKRLQKGWDKRKVFYEPKRKYGPERKRS